MDFLNAAARAARRGGGPSLLALLLLLLAGHPSPVPAQPRPSFSLAEVRQIQAVREQLQSGQPAALVKAAQAYLKKFPQGRYRDETLMALAEGHARGGAPREALAAYGRVIEKFPDGPFREQAMLGSIPLLQGVGETEQAKALSARVLELYPRSLFRGQTLLWQAREAYDRGAFNEALALLNRINPEEGELRGGNKAEFFRLAGWAHHKSGAPSKAWPFFARYLELDDATERMAPVLMLMAAAYRASGDHARALEHYARVVERHPQPEHLPEALYRRAELFTAAEVGGAEPAARPEALAQAIAYHDAYLESGNDSFREPALKTRARLLLAAGRKEEALRDHQALLALREVHRQPPELLTATAGLLADLERGAEGVALLGRAIANSATPRRSRAALAVERAALQYRLEDCPGVLAGLKPLPVFSDGAQRRRAFFLRGFCLYRLGRWEKASWDLEGLVGEPEYVDAVWPALAEAYRNSGQVSRLVNTGERLLETGRIEPSQELFLRLGSGYEELGQPAMMLSAFERLAKLNPEAVEEPAVQVRMGRAEEALGNLERAEAHYLAAMAPDAPEGGGLHREYLEGLERLQGLYQNRGEFEQLTALNSEAAGRATSAEDRARIARWQAMAHLRSGEVEARAGRGEAALGRFQQAWQALPASAGGERVEILAALTGQLAANGNHEQARKLFAGELKTAQAPAYRAKVSQQFGLFYLAWAQATEEEAPPAATAGRYERAMKLLPKAKWRERYGAATRLDEFYRKTGKHGRRAEMFDRLAEKIPTEPLRERLRTYRASIYGDWSRQQLARKKFARALELNAKGAALLKDEEWRLRYDLLAGKGEIYLKQGRFSQLLIEYERFLPSIPEPELSAQVSHFVGQVYLTWAERAKKAKNVKSTRIRAHRALDYLPASDWKRRLAATRLLAKALEAEEKPRQGADMYAALVPQLPEGKIRQQYALFLGRRYAKKLQAPDEARKWLKTADAGGVDALSVEAAYTLAELERAQKKTDAALAMLEDLKGRGLDQSKWQVPVYSRLAVIYHQRNDLGRALAHYRVVANVKSKEQRRLYPRSIQVAREQVRAIKGYMKFRGGQAGKKIAVPKIKN